MQAKLELSGNLSVLLIRKDGTHREIPNLSSDALDPARQEAKLKAIERSILLRGLEDTNLRDIKGLVTTAGVNYIATYSGSYAINTFTYSDCGTGTTAASISQTALVTPWGGARVNGTQSNPTAGTYQSVATIAFTGSFAIAEYGLFSASTSGTMWDRRVFTAINVNSGDSIQFTYAVVINAGGS